MHRRPIDLIVDNGEVTRVFSFSRFRGLSIVTRALCVRSAVDKTNEGRTYRVCVISLRLDGIENVTLNH